MERRGASGSGSACHGKLRDDGASQHHHSRLDGADQHPAAATVHIGAPGAVFLPFDTGKRRVCREPDSGALNPGSRPVRNVHTGAKVDKFRKAQLTPEPAQSVACPLIAECPLSLECRVTDVLPQGTHDLFLADIVAVDVDESVLDGTGRLRLDKAELAAFAHGEYFALGRRIGKFGMSVARRDIKKSRKITES